MRGLQVVGVTQTRGQLPDVVELVVGLQEAGQRVHVRLVIQEQELLVLVRVIDRVAGTRGVVGIEGVEDVAQIGIRRTGCRPGNPRIVAQGRVELAEVDDVPVGTTQLRLLVGELRFRVVVCFVEEVGPADPAQLVVGGRAGHQFMRIPLGLGVEGEALLGIHCQIAQGRAGRRQLVGLHVRRLVQLARRGQAVVVLGVAAHILQVPSVEMVGPVEVQAERRPDLHAHRHGGADGAVVGGRRVHAVRATGSLDHGAGHHALTEGGLRVVEQAVGAHQAGVVRADGGNAQQGPRTTAVVVERQVIGHEPDVVLVGLPLELKFDIGVVVHFTEGLAAEVLEVPLVLIDVVAAQAEVHAGNEGRTGDGAFELRIFVVAHRRAHFTAEGIGGVAGLGVDDAADGVTAVQGVLRAQQHFDLIHDHVVATDEEGRVGEEVVVVDAHRAVSQVDVGRPRQTAHDRTVELAGIGQTRREVGHVLNGVDPDQGPLLGGEGGHGHRHLLDVHRALFSGNHDFLDGVRALGGGGRVGRRIACKGRRRHDKGRHRRPREPQTTHTKTRSHKHFPLKAPALMRRVIDFCLLPATSGSRSHLPFGKTHAAMQQTFCCIAATPWGPKDSTQGLARLL